FARQFLGGPAQAPQHVGAELVRFGGARDGCRLVRGLNEFHASLVRRRLLNGQRLGRRHTTYLPHCRTAPRKRECFSGNSLTPLPLAPLANRTFSFATNGRERYDQGALGRSAG